MQVRDHVIPWLVGVSALAVAVTYAAPVITDNEGASADIKLLSRSKRADEMIFDSPKVVKKSEPVVVPEVVAQSTDVKTPPTDNTASKEPADKEAEVPAAADDVSDDEAEPSDVSSESESDDVEEEHDVEQGDATDDANDEDDGAEEEGEGVEQTVEDDEDSDVDESDDVRDKRSAAATGSRMQMVAENMALPEQKFRAKRDLDADDIRQLLESQRLQPDQYYADDYGYGESSESEPELDDVDDDTNYDGYYDVHVTPAESFQDLETYDEGRPKRLDEEEYVAVKEAEREAVKEFLAERAAEEAKEALIEYLTSGEPLPPVVPPEPNFVGTLVEDDDDDEEMLPRNTGAFYEVPDMETEKRFFPYSYEPYGGRWGALVPGSKRGDRDPYDRLYRLAEVLSKPARLGDDQYVDRK